MSSATRRDMTVLSAGIRSSMLAKSEYYINNDCNVLLVCIIEQGMDFDRI